jgi:hypothetical protein
VEALSEHLPIRIEFIETAERVEEMMDTGVHASSDVEIIRVQKAPLNPVREQAAP